MCAVQICIKTRKEEKNWNIKSVASSAYLVSRNEVVDGSVSNFRRRGNTHSLPIKTSVFF